MSQLKKILHEKCNRFFYPKRRTICKNIVDKLIVFPTFKIDANFKEFSLIINNGELVDNVNIIDYLCFVTDEDIDDFRASVLDSDKFEKISNCLLVGEKEELQYEVLHV